VSPQPPALAPDNVAAPLGVADELFFAAPPSEQGRLAKLKDAPIPPEMAAAMEMPEESSLLKLGPAECSASTISLYCTWDNTAGSLAIERAVLRA
jgi:hypothetical protein